jgi:hypothetical protein
MPCIPPQVKPPARTPLHCKLTVDMAALVKHYAEFIDSTQEHVVTEALRRVFDRDKEFQVWLAATHSQAPVAKPEPENRPPDKARFTSSTAVRASAGQERLGS